MDTLNDTGTLFSTIFWCCFLGFAGFISLCMIFAKETKFEKRFYTVLSLFCYITVALFVFAHIFKSVKFYNATIIAFGFALLLFMILFRYKYKQCNVLVKAKLKDVARRSRSGFTYYLTLFSFEHNGKNYECYDMYSRDKRTIKKYFIVGNSYDIYINPKDPSTYCSYKEIKKVSHIFIYTLSLIIIIFGIFVVIMV